MKYLFTFIYYFIMFNFSHPVKPFLGAQRSISITFQAELIKPGTASYSLGYMYWGLLTKDIKKTLVNEMKSIEIYLTHYEILQPSPC